MPARSYHCICTTFILAMNYELESLPVRAEPALDKAIILPIQDDGAGNEHVSFYNVNSDHKPIVIRREDGFEKRTLLRCERCSLTIGYKINREMATEEQRHLDEDITYILPGSLVSTEAVKAGKVS